MTESDRLLTQHVNGILAVVPPEHHRAIMQVLREQLPLMLVTYNERTQRATLEECASRGGTWTDAERFRWLVNNAVEIDGGDWIWSGLSDLRQLVDRGVRKP